MMKKKYERRNQDIGNIISIEHANVRVPDQSIATAFYVMGLGFTRDPYLMVGLDNMWINLGQHQFHLPTGAPQVFPGCIDMIVPDLDALATRLGEVKDRLAGTAFSCSVEDKHVSVTCPWGNRMRFYAPGAQYGDLTLGMAAVESPVPLGSAAGIARFYETVMQSPASVTPNGEGSVARVKVGPRQDLVFRETAAEIPAYDGHHIAIYITDFSGTQRRLGQRRLISEESNEHQYRFKDIVDPDSGEHLFTLEHEVRSYTHPMFLRPLVNRNPAQRQPTYQRGRDAFVPGMA
jgi:hypothetical protein